MTTPAPVALTTIEQVVLTATETNANGGTVTPSDTFTWAVDNPAVASVTPSEDSFSATAVALTAGTANVTVTDPAAGLTSAPLQLDVTEAPPTAIDVTAGTPEAQPAPAPAA
jgi:hypothetical protein